MNVVKAERRRRTIRDPVSRLEQLLEQSSGELRRSFLSIMARLRATWTLAQIEQAIVRGLGEQLAAPAVQQAAQQFAGEVVRVYLDAGRNAAQFLRDSVKVGVSFDPTRQPVVGFTRKIRTDLVREVTKQQRDAIRAALEQGLESGMNPRDVARLFRGSIGLTAYQQQTVGNYRRALRTGSSDALDRSLRDHRFDSTVERAVTGDRVLTRAQIDLMTQRYGERALAARAETIARTEALSAVHAGNFEMYDQAYEDGTLDPQFVTREWNTAADARVRDSHIAMHGQTRGAKEPFLSGDGNKLMYPGDPSAPASDRIKCRCAVGTRISLEFVGQP